MAVRLSSEMRALAHQLRYEPSPRLSGQTPGA